MYFFSFISYLVAPAYCSKLALCFKSEPSVMVIYLSALCSTPRDTGEVKLSGKIFRKQAVLATP